MSNTILSNTNIRKQDFIVFRRKSDGYITNLVAPNDFQIGLLDSGYVSDLSVTGNITGSGHIAAGTGLSGSLTKLIDGTSYLIAGTNITIASASNGAVTVSSTAGGGASSVGWLGSASALIETTGSLGVSGSLFVANKIEHISDSDTFISFTPDDINIQAGGVDFIKITEDDSQDKITFNDGGADVDFIVETPNESKAIYINAANEVLHINHGESNFQTKIHNDNDQIITVDNTGVIFNEDSHADIDFRVESDGEDEALFLDSSSNTLYVNKGATAFTTVIKNNNEEVIRVGAAGAIFNDYGHASNDLRVESDNNTHMFFVDSGNDRVGIGSDGPATTLHIKDSSPGIRIQRESQSETSTLDFAGAAGVVGASIAHAGITNDLVFSSYNGSTTEEMLRMGDYYSGNNRQVIFLSGSTIHAGAMQPREAADIAFFVSGAIGSRMSTTKGTAVFGGDLYVSGTLHAPFLREKSHIDVTGSHPTGNRFTTTVNFTKKDHDPNRIDIYLNGVHMRTGSSQDYIINTDNTLSFNGDLENEDVVLVVTF